MKQIILLLLFSLIVACGGGSKDTQDPNQNDNENAQENLEQEELFTITLKEDEKIADFIHKATFITQGNKFEFDVTSNDFCVVLKKSQFKTLSIRIAVVKKGWSYISVSDYYCDNNTPEGVERNDNVPGRGNIATPEKDDDCEIPIKNLFLEVNSVFWGYEYNIAEAEKRNPNINKCNKLY